MSNLLNTITKILGEVQVIAQKYFWPTYEIEELPLKLQERIAVQSLEVQEDFLMDYELNSLKPKRRRNFVAVAAAFFLLSGAFPITFGLMAYLWHVKEHKVALLASNTFKDTLIRHGLISADSRSFLRSGKSTKRMSKLHKKIDRKVRRQVEFPSANQNPFQTRKTVEEQPQFDPTNLTLSNLRTGYLLDYDFKTWEVESINQYDWDFGGSQRETKLADVATGQAVYLHQERDRLLTVSKRVNIHSIDANLEGEIAQSRRPYNILTYQGISYYKENTHEGKVYSSKNKSQTGIQVNVWEYFDGKRQQYIRIAQTSNAQLYCTIGKIVNEIDFTDILPKA